MKKQFLFKKMLCKTLMASILFSAFFVKGTPVHANGIDGDLTYEEGAVDYISTEMRQ